MQMHADRRWDSRISQPEVARRFAEGPAENPAEVRGVGARAFAAHPTILLIDEMSLGLAPGVFLRLLPIVEHIAATGVGVLLVEQFTHLALKIATEALVITGGRVSYAGSADVLMEEPEMLQNAYLG